MRDVLQSLDRWFLKLLNFFGGHVSKRVVLLLGTPLQSSPARLLICGNILLSDPTSSFLIVSAADNARVTMISIVVECTEKSFVRISGGFDRCG